MLSLAFMCSRQLVSDHRSLRSALPLIPDELYPLLFRAAFLDKDMLVLQDLVQRWPFSVLNLQRLLQGDGHHRPIQLFEKENRLCVHTIIMSVMAHLKEEIARQKEGQPLRKKRLRLLDMTGIHDNGLELDPYTMSLCFFTIVLAKSCIDIVNRQIEEAVQVSKRRRGLLDAACSSAADCSPVFLELRADLFVNSTSYAILREALLVGNQGPLHLQCRDIRAEELSLRSTMGLLELLNPASLRQIDLRFNNLGLPGLNALLPYMRRFSRLQSLKLPYSNIDVRRLSATAEEDLQNFASQICELPALKDLRYLRLFYNPLSGQGIRMLLQSSLHLADLQLVIYPFPVEFYLNPTVQPDFSNPALNGCIDHGQVSGFQAELQEALVRAQRTDMVWTTDMVLHRPPEYLSL
ncbi:hypothetical protein GDO78_015436 [Eleutherodactylus coqui]|uniref:Leucine-rich repeat-containing protein 14 n=1 Tax=Eleutherodactylus coqui TaxID=57060 RepID=A0A8J6EDP2_ELECQ|nr:hypothetical protein GDO78_015436 [Eleutherodactylus coqui]